MNSHLIDVLKTIEDFRAPRGRRYPLWLILLLAILGTLSGCKGYKALEDFGIRHCGAVCEHLGIALKRLPSDSTFRQIFQHLDFERLSQAFAVWTRAEDQQQGQQWWAVDGKGIGGTVCDRCEAYQNFVSLVSVYSHQQGIVVALQQFENKAASEIAVVRTLLERLDCREVVFTFDALHAQKNTGVNC